MKTVVSFSGGKDSTAMLLWMLERGEKVDDVVFFDGGWEFPEMYDHLAKVEEHIGFKINVVRPPEPFTYTLTAHRHVIRRGKYAGQEMIGYGFPGFGTRWCTGRKQTALDKYFGQYKQIGVKDCIGYAADEVTRMGNVRPNKWHKYRFPLIEAGMTEKDALKYCYDRGFDWGGLIHATSGSPAGVVRYKTYKLSATCIITIQNFGRS